MWPWPLWVLSPLQVQIWKSLKILEPALRVDEKSANWRNHVMHYRPAEHCQLKPGTVSLSPAWFQQGHKVWDLLDPWRKFEWSAVFPVQAWSQRANEVWCHWGALEPGNARVVCFDWWHPEYHTSTTLWAGNGSTALPQDRKWVCGWWGRIIHGAQACISYYMRNKVHERLGVPAGTWMNTSIYEC